MLNPIHWPIGLYAPLGLAIFITWIVVLVRSPRPAAAGQRWAPRDRRRALFLTLGMFATVLLIDAVTVQRSLLQMRDSAIARMNTPAASVTEKIEGFGPFVTRYRLSAPPTLAPNNNVRLNHYNVELGPPDYIVPFFHCFFMLAVAWIIRGIAALIRNRRRKRGQPATGV